VLREHGEPSDVVDLDYNAAMHLARSWSSGRISAQRKVNAILAKHGLTREVVFAQALSNKLDEYDRIERMIASADARRNAVLREVDLRRAGFKERLHRVSDQIIDAELTELSPRGFPGPT
jgi:hypothetical protein